MQNGSIVSHMTCLREAFGTADRSACVKKILDEGEAQLTEEERSQLRDQEERAKEERERVIGAAGRDF